MKISYIYKKGHQEILSKIEERLKYIEEAVNEEYNVRISSMHEVLKSGISPHFLDKVYPPEYERLREDLVYLKSILVPEKIIVEGEKEEIVL